jgi:hypothetical protein
MKELLRVYEETIKFERGMLGKSKRLPAGGTAFLENGALAAV